MRGTPHTTPLRFGKKEGIIMKISKTLKAMELTYISMYPTGDEDDPTRRKALADGAEVMLFEYYNTAGINYDRRITELQEEALRRAKGKYSNLWA